MILYHQIGYVYKMNNVALVTPNTDTFTNPTMTTLFHGLKLRGVEVVLFGPMQQPSCPDNLTNVREIHSVFRLNLLRNPKYYLKHWVSYLRIVRTIRREKISVLMAVDPMGLIAGGRIKKLMSNSIHLSYLSLRYFSEKNCRDIIWR